MEKPTGLVFLNRKPVTTTTTTTTTKNGWKRNL